MYKLDIHNQNRFEAKVNITIFLNEAYQLRHKQVIITHGYGELILKKVVEEVLKNNKVVENHCIAPYQLGGGGATLVTLKNKKMR